MHKNGKKAYLKVEYKQTDIIWYDIGDDDEDEEEEEEE